MYIKITNKIIYIFLFVTIFLGCDNIILNKQKAQIALNNHYVTIIISKLNYYKYKKSTLPNKIDELNDYDIIKDILLKRDVFYNRDGFLDHSGNLWLIVLYDKGMPSSLFVGNLNDNKMIPREEINFSLVKIPSDSKIDTKEEIF
ncbi:MAG: hypothetical protein ACMUIL_06190 [bacterium]